MKIRVILCLLLIQSISQAQDKSALFNRPVAESNPLRTEQARELDEYIKTIAADRSQLLSLIHI